MHLYSRKSCGLLFAIIVALLAPNAFAGGKPVRLVIEAPEKVKPGGQLLTEGWALTFSMEVENAVAFVAENIESGSGDLNKRQALIYEDPDGCLDVRSLSPDGMTPFEFDCAGQDEGFFEFYFDPFDGAAQRESHCAGLSPSLFLVDDAFDPAGVENLNKPYVETAPPSAQNPRAVGARTGGMRDMTTFPSAFDDPAFDCYGYDADIDGVPGLLVWADIGGFKVMDEDLNGTGLSGEVRRLRNGAGFTTNVTSVLLDNKNRSNVKATIIVPLGLFEPIIAIDTDINPSGPHASADYLRKIDDGPIEPLIFDPPVSSVNVARARAISRDLPPVRVTVKAVLIEGTAPDFITDVNMDGKFTRADLIAEGHTLLSNVARYRIRALRAYNIESSEDRCPPQGMLVAKDMDGADPVGAGQIYFCATGSARSGRRVPR